LVDNSLPLSDVLNLYDDWLQEKGFISKEETEDKDRPSFAFLTCGGSY
jgi:hypothetical protein